VNTTASRIPRTRRCADAAANGDATSAPASTLRQDRGRSALSRLAAHRPRRRSSNLDSGQNIETPAARLGHSPPAITLALYVHPVDERDAEAVEHFGKLIERR
jgi:hypothetical protein